MRLSFAARWNLSRNAAMVVVAGRVLGISMKDVTPPAAAARVSERMLALCVSPGSRKCTWSSITPGIRYIPLPSITLSLLRQGSLPSVHISTIFVPLITTEPMAFLPSFTIVTFAISVRMVLVFWKMVQCVRESLFFV